MIFPAPKVKRFAIKLEAIAIFGSNCIRLVQAEAVGWTLCRACSAPGRESTRTP